MGVRRVWVIDLGNRTGYDCGTAAWLPVEELRIPESLLFLRLVGLWNGLAVDR